jgi:hypothetical protein
MRLATALRRRRILFLVLAAFSGFSILSWSSGSLWATWGIECNVGTVAWDLVHGLQPGLSLYDYAQRYATGYLLAGVAAAPLVALGVPAALALKLLALGTGWAVISLGWELVDRLGPPPAADLAAAALAAPVPLVWAYMLQAGNYHFTELVPDLGTLLLAAEILTRQRRSAWVWAALGAVAGLAVCTSFGAAAFVLPALAWTLWAGSAWRGPASWIVLPSFVLGCAPLLHKVLVFEPSGGGAGAGLRSLNVQPDSGAVLGKLGHAVVDFPLGLAFADAWRFVPGALANAAAFLWAGIGLACLLALAIRAGRAALPLGAASAPSDLATAQRAAASRRGLLLLPLALVAFSAAYLLSDQRISAARGIDAQLRSSRFLPAPTALLSLAPAILLASLSPSARQARRLALAAAAALPLLGAPSWLAAVDWGSAGAGLPYRGRCYDLIGLYLSDTHPDPLGPAEDWRLCRDFEGPGAAAECFAGWTWSVGQVHLRHDSSGWRLDETGVRACRSLPEAWRAECWRMVGWGITMRSLPELGADTPRDVARACDALPGDAPAACREGYGFYLGDHYAYAPRKLEALVLRDAPDAASATAWYRGVAVLLRHELANLAAAARWCEGLSAAEARDACRAGLAAAAAVESRPLPD